jgi:hypothetical protein
MNAPTVSRSYVIAHRRAGVGAIMAATNFSCALASASSSVPRNCTPLRAAMSAGRHLPPQARGERCGSPARPGRSAAAVMFRSMPPNTMPWNGEMDRQ